MTDTRFQVEHRPEQSRYVLLDRGDDGTDDKEIGEEAYLDAAGDKGTERILYHTLVSEDYGGQGLAAVLVRQVVEEAVAAGHAIVPVCPYVASWLRKNDEYAAHVVTPTHEHLEAVRKRPR